MSMAIQLNEKCNVLAPCYISALRCCVLRFRAMAKFKKACFPPLEGAVGLSDGRPHDGGNGHMGKNIDTVLPLTGFTLCRKWFLNQ